MLDSSADDLFGNRLPVPPFSRVWTRLNVGIQLHCPDKAHAPRETVVPERGFLSISGWDRCPTGGRIVAVNQHDYSPGRTPVPAMLAHPFFTAVRQRNGGNAPDFRRDVSGLFPGHRCPGQADLPSWI